MSGLDPFGVYKIHDTKTNGVTWYSRKWHNGHPRTLGESDFDPHDHRLQFANGAPNVDLRINGNGQAYVQDYSSSGRIFISGPWVNTEMTAYVKCEGSMGSIVMYCRGNHEIPSLISGTSCGFGGYVFKWSDIPGTLAASVEVHPMHPTYVRHLGEVPFAGTPRGSWIGYKMVVRTVTADADVKVEGYINYNEFAQQSSDWTKLTEYTFTGSNVLFLPLDSEESYRVACVDHGDLVANDMEGIGTCWLNPGTANWLRINEVDGVKVKWMSCREIDPA